MENEILRFVVLNGKIMKKITALILAAIIFSSCTAQSGVTEENITTTAVTTTDITTTEEKVTTSAVKSTEAVVTTAYTPPQLREADSNFTYMGGIEGGKTVCGIKDEASQNRINSFISDVSDELLSHKDEVSEMYGYISGNGELVKPEPELSYYVSVTNGYISVIVGYISKEMDSLRLGEKWYMCETAVFDIVSGEQITDFADLFVDGFDWEEALEKDLRQITDVYYLNKSDYDAEKALAGGYKFTAEKIIFPYGTFGNDGNELNFLGQYWFSFISQGCKSSIPRDYSEFVTGEVKTRAIPETMEYDVIIGGNIYGNRIAYSRVMTDEEIEQENTLYEKIQSELVSEYFTVTTERKINTYFCTITKTGDFYDCYFGNFIDRLCYLYNSDGEKVTLADLVNENYYNSDLEHPLDYYEVAEVESKVGGCHVFCYKMQDMDNQYSGYTTDGVYNAVCTIELSEEEISDLLLRNKEYLK